MHKVDLQREILVIQAMLAGGVEMELQQLVVAVADLRHILARVRRCELDRVAVVLDQELADLRVLQGDVPPDDVGVDVDRRLVLARRTRRIGVVESVPEKGPGLPGVGPVGGRGIPLVDARGSEGGERCREDERSDEEAVHCVCEIKERKKKGLQPNVSKKKKIGDKGGGSYRIRYIYIG